MKIPRIRFVFARKGVSPKDGKGMVELVITHERQRKFLSTGVSCLPHQWKDDAKRNIYVSGTGADLEMNQILLTLYQNTGACFYNVMNEQSLFVFTVSLQNRYFLTKGISQETSHLMGPIYIIMCIILLTLRF